MDDFRKIFYGVLIGFIVVIGGWISLVTFFGCGSSLNCALAAPTAERTSIPTLVPGTLPAVKLQLGSAGAASPTAAGGAAPTEEANGVPRPTNPGGPGPAVQLTGNAAAGQQVFAANCQICHGAEGKGGNPNPGSTDGTIPPLNPIDPLLTDADPHVFTTNIDLFIEHGSTPDGPGPTFSMPAWGDKQLIAPQQIADVMAYILSLNPVAAAPGGGAASGPTATSAPTAAAAGAASPTAASGAAPTEEANGVPRPTNPGGPGPALALTGNAASGQQVFAANCQICHGADGKGGNPNPGSTDGTIPPLNPIDPLLKDPSPAVFAENIDLFVEHGSTPDGPGPTFSMPAWGDKQLITPQQIADVIAYVLSLNP